ncbi:MAG TPA: hypothetical protein DHW61_01800 [Lachnoclostridium phytofermentans]|uniref:Uncharacterized protein n=1 Tax=Lachnoclostridium phytofermentans TaxID=66219 RepID=A0A3D2X3D8_9FIRM|nr:hypothetical protein [Lachnoclostridium sp.]HCL01143.1 hypothetical protein [Lachnoclostridium phytofermentans]
MFGTTNKGGGGSLSTAINGTKKKYYAYASQDIKKGDFVHFQTGVSGIGAGTASWRSSGIFLPLRVQDHCKAIKLNETNVIMVYKDGNYVPTVKAVTVDGVELIGGNAIVMGGNEMSKDGCRINVARIDNSRALFTCIASGISGMSTILYARVLTISGNTISAGTTLAMSLNINSPNYLISGEESTRLICYGDMAYLTFAIWGSGSTSTTDIYTARLNISGTTVSADSIPTEYLYYVRYENSSSNTYSMTQLGETNKLITLCNNGNSTMTFVYVTQLGAKGVASTRQLVNTNIPWTGGYNNIFNILSVSDNQIIIVGKSTNGGEYKAYVMGLLVNSNNTVTFSNPGVVLSESTSYVQIGPFAKCSFREVGNSRIMLNYTIAVDTDKFIHNRVVTLNGAVPSIGPDLQLSLPNGETDKSYFQKSGCCQLTASKVLICSQAYNIPMQGMVLNAPSNAIETINYFYETQVRKALNNDDINGIAIEDAKGGVLTGASAAHNQACDVISITSPS